MERIIILSNPGSASKKYSIYREGVEVAWFHLEAMDGGYMCSCKIVSTFEKKFVTDDEYRDSLSFVIAEIQKAGLTREPSDIQAVSIRTVIPDPDFVSDSLLTAPVAKYLKKLSVLDPLHLNPLMDEIESIKKSVSKRTFVCLISDSSFHVSGRRKLPVDIGRDVYTIGYHGLSCESALSLLEKSEVKHSKLVVCHLGGGSSVTAIMNGKSMYNSMEYSPLGGTFMATRPGSIDPFLVLQIMHEKKLSYEEGLKFLYTSSGLKALSKVSGDLREVREEAFKGSQHAKQAIMQFVNSIASYICTAASYAGGMDTLVFTGTIGFRAAYIREMVTQRLSWLGIKLNYDRNLDDLTTCFEISTHDSPVRVVVVQIDEMREMHRHTVELLRIKI